jgi:hypothetical protein
MQTRDPFDMPSVTIIGGVSGFIPSTCFKWVVIIIENHWLISM